MSTAASLGYDGPLYVLRGASGDAALPDEFEFARSGATAPEASALAALSDTVHSESRRLLVELALPESHVDAAVAAVELFQETGVEVDVWAFRGFDASDDFERIAKAVRAGGRDGVGWLIAEPGNAPGLESSLRRARDTVGFLGFIIDEPANYARLLEVCRGS